MNPRQLQQMAQQMQRQMAKIQEELGNEMVEGSAGSYISVTMNGHREIQAIKLAPGQYADEVLMSCPVK